MKSHSGQKNNGTTRQVEPQSDEIGACVLCGSRSVCKCARCGDFYCSPQCQCKDWPNHRYICFPMPRLVKASHWSPQKENGVIEVEAPPLKNRTSNQDYSKAEKEVIKRIIEGTKMPTSESCVILTGFMSSNRCYIRSTNPSDNENYKKILKEIDDFGKTAPALAFRPKINSFALTLREGKWCRGQIAGHFDNGCHIHLIDYGEFCRRSKKDLREINDRLISLPCLIHMVRLKDIHGVSTASALLDSLAKYTNQEYKVVFEKEDAVGGNAKLYNWKTKALLNTEISKLCGNLGNNRKSMEADPASNASSQSNGVINKNGMEQSTSNKSSIQPKNNETSKANTPKTAQAEGVNDKENSPAPSSVSKEKAVRKPHQIQTPKPCLEPPFDINPLNENDRDCKVIVTDDSFIEAGYFGCLMEKYRDNLREVFEFLKNYSVTDQSYQPKLNEYCLAKFESEWYRAKVIEITSNDQYRVTYIDFTNEMEVTSSSIRRYPMSLTVPCNTTFCAIGGLPEDDLSDELIAFLKSECAAFSELHIDNIRVVEGVCHVESKQLLKKLHDKKLI